MRRRDVDSVRRQLDRLEQTVRACSYCVNQIEVVYRGEKAEATCCPRCSRPVLTVQVPFCERS